MNITYRKATAEDAAALLDFLKTVGSESDNLSFGSEGVPITAQQEAAYLQSLQTNPNAAMILALDGEEIVGNASIDGSSRPRFCHRKTIAITVRKSHWGQGIGTCLMEQLIAFAQKTDTEGITLEVRSDNLRAKALYEKFGFRTFGVYEKFFKIDGNYFSADYMNLYL